LVNLANKDEFLIDKKIVVALSGGIDSVVLLHFLNKHYPAKLELYISTTISQTIAINGNLSAKTFARKQILILKVLIYSSKMYLTSKKLLVKIAISH